MSRIYELIRRKPNRWGNITIKEFERDIKLLQETCRIYEDALREIDTHIRSTEKPVKYIIETLKSVLPEYKN